MSRRPVEPHGTAGGPLTPYVVLGVAWSRSPRCGWRGPRGRIAGAVTGRRGGPDFGPTFVAGLIRADWAALWPDIPTATRRGRLRGARRRDRRCAGWAWSWWQARRPDAEDPLPSLAGARTVESLMLPAVAAKARRLVPSLAATPVKLIPAGQAGVALGSLRTPRRKAGPALYASWEDVVLAVMAPRAGKTTALTAPAVLAAPGAVIATSNKPDLWATTAADRAAVGRVWVFDPQAITHEPHGRGGGTRSPWPARGSRRSGSPTTSSPRSATTAAARTSGRWPPTTCSPAFILAAAVLRRVAGRRADVAVRRHRPRTRPHPQSDTASTPPPAPSPAARPAPPKGRCPHRSAWLPGEPTAAPGRISRRRERGRPGPP